MARQARWEAHQHCSRMWRTAELNTRVPFAADAAALKAATTSYISGRSSEQSGQLRGSGPAPQHSDASGGGDGIEVVGVDAA